MNFTNLLIKLYACSAMGIGAFWIIVAQFGYQMSPQTMTSMIGGAHLVIGFSFMFALPVFEKWTPKE